MYSLTSYKGKGLILQMFRLRPLTGHTVLSKPEVTSLFEDTTHSTLSPTLTDPVVVVVKS